MGSVKLPSEQANPAGMSAESEPPAPPSIRSQAKDTLPFQLTDQPQTSLPRSLPTTTPSSTSRRAYRALLPPKQMDARKIDAATSMSSQLMAGRPAARKAQTRQDGPRAQIGASAKTPDTIRPPVEKGLYIRSEYAHLSDNELERLDLDPDDIYASSSDTDASGSEADVDLPKPQSHMTDTVKEKPLQSSERASQIFPLKGNI